MDYSVRMNTTEAPDLTPGYPSKGSKLGPAWNDLWTELSRASKRTDPFMEGRGLAAEVAHIHGLNQATLVALLSRAAKAGKLARENRMLKGSRGLRPHAHYRINA